MRFCIISNRTAEVASVTLSERWVAALVSCSRHTATRFTTNRRTTATRMMPKFMYSFLPIVITLHFLNSRSEWDLLVRIKMKFHNGRRLVLGGFVAPLLDGVHGRVREHWVPAD